MLHNAEQSLSAYTNGPRILQEWTSPPVATMEYTFAGMPQGARPLQLKLNGAPVLLQPAQFILHGATSILINATPQASCLGWVSSDILVIGGGATLQVRRLCFARSPSHARLGVGRTAQLQQSSSDVYADVGGWKHRLFSSAAALRSSQSPLRSFGRSPQRRSRETSLSAHSRHQRATASDDPSAGSLSRVPRGHLCCPVSGCQQSSQPPQQVCA